jgi:hypothetical protein
MKASVIRKLAAEHAHSVLAEAAEVMAEHETDPLGVEGDDLGEKLTHVMLAMRVRERVEAGEELKDAFRVEMASVRDLLTNEPG